MNENFHIGSDALTYLESIVPDTPETRRIEKQERFRFNLTQAMRDLRERVGLTQNDLAQKLGIGQSWVSKLESANNDHTFESVLAYFDALDAIFQVQILLESKKVAIITSDPSSFMTMNAVNETTKKPLKEKGLSASQSPNFDLIHPEYKSKIRDAKSVVNSSGLWGVPRSSAA